MGLLGGTWLTRWFCDLGNGKFDGAHLVSNFEGLNPANTFWDKYYHLYANVDTEPPRFLDFERWWGGFYLLNEEEICWIVNELFVGNRLARGEIQAAPGTYLDLKDIRSPIVIFSSAGDNITPPQQALNWIADVYSSTEEIKANGQVIVGLFHESDRPPRRLRFRQGRPQGVFPDRRGAQVDRATEPRPLPDADPGRARPKAGRRSPSHSRRNGWKTCVGSTSWSGVMSDPSRWYRPFRNSASGPT